MAGWLANQINLVEAEPGRLEMVESWAELA